jgi:hypothetical protein
MPASFTIQQLVVRVGEFGGYIIVETDKVVDVMDAVAVEVNAIEYRKKNAP